MSINPKVHLSAKIFKDDIDQIPTRFGYGEGLVVAGEKDARVVALCADLTESTRTIEFQKKFPDRFLEIGVAEQLLVTVASGMANYGKIPFVASYAAFSPGRNWEQIRTTIALNDVPVKIAGCHAGVSVGPDGATHQMLEDVAIMRAMPRMTVICPADAVEGKKAVIAAAKTNTPVYLRFTREKTPVFTTTDTPFVIGKSYKLWESKDPQATIIGYGPLLYQTLIAAKNLLEAGIEVDVINCHTIKPIDEQAIITAARRSGAIVTVEEHQITGGLGSAVAEIITKNWSVPVEFIGMPNTFGESGQAEELLKKYGMTAHDIVEAVKKVIKRKMDKKE